MNGLRLLLISSAVPRDTTAGEVLLYRHFSRFPGLSLAIASDNLEGVVAETLLEVKANRLLDRLTITRFSKWAHDICQCIHPFFNYTILRNYIKTYQPDLIITVAEGIHWIAAQKMSQEFNIPLVTIFHDWWTDLALIHPWAKATLDRRFKQLYQHSKLVFCVSGGMQQLLGEHPNAQVLYPIPMQVTKVEQPIPTSTQEKFKLVYAGSLSGIYASMLQDLCVSLQEIQGLQLKLFGPQPYWSSAILKQINEQNIYGGFLSKGLMKRELSIASALLVTTSFCPNYRRWAETSFPSKLVEYCQYNKPIIIWGPEYCSAVQWGRKYQSGLVVTSPSAQDLVKAIKELATQLEEQARLKNKSLEMALGMFNPEKIQQQFVDSLHQVVASKPNYNKV